MHQIDSCAIISFFKTILLKFRGCVVIPLNITGADAVKLTGRLRMLLGKELDWLSDHDSVWVGHRKPVLHVIPIDNILGKRPVVS
jgi:hypothetical protein